MEIVTLHSTNTEYSADSIEWCPHPDFKEYFVCGTYQLEGDNSESTSPPCRRKGKIYLYKYDYIKDQLTAINNIDTAAILDMKWLNDSKLNEPILGVANALGQIQTYKLNINEKLICTSTIHLNSEYHNLLALSLDWELNTQRLIASDSKGDITILQLTNDDLRIIHTWNSHSFEAWTCTFDKWNKNLIYSGGDDTFLHVYDIRCTNAVQKICTNKSHIAGVTTLLSHPIKENILLTGSYDESLRIFNTTEMKQPICDINLKGGIWRLKSNPENHNLILCACMYHNFSIVEMTDNLNMVNLIGEYNEHKSICYGADWYQTNNNDEHMIMATCSFYDNKLCISSVKNF